MLPLLALFAAASPVAPPPAAPIFSLVVATSGTQVDPRPAPCGADGSCGDFLYRSTFTKSRNLAGAPLPRAFEARLTLHTPYISRYTLALIVERRANGELLVRRQAGFNGRTGIACFDEPSEFPVAWTPTGPGIAVKGGTLCVEDKTQIDPHAPPTHG
jgi:hypothetical protein